MSATALDPEVADQTRLKALCAQADRDATVLVEMVAQGRWVRFDLSLLEAQHVSADVLFTRYFGKAFDTLGIRREAPASDQSSSSTSVKE